MMCVNLGTFPYNRLMIPLECSFLGQFQVVWQGIPLTDFRSDKIRALLAYLAVEAGIPHRREALATLLWPESADALRNLRKSLHLLRQTLDRCEAGLSDRVLLVTRQTVMALETAVSLETHHFEQAITQVTTHAHQTVATCPACLTALQEATTLYQGDFLRGLTLPDALGFEEWLLLKRENLHQAALTSLRQLADAHEQRGMFDKAQQAAARQISLEPWHEGAYRQSMRLLARQGRRGEALAQYELCREVLAAELGVEPGAETLALHQQISQGEFSTGEPAEVQVLLHHFPPQFNQFVGRGEEVTAVVQHLLDPDCRLLTLLGPGGIGKTRLSLEAVAQAVTQHPALAADHFAGGCYFVALADAVNRDLFVATTAKALNITFQATDNPEQQLLRYLADKKILLVLDNFEQLVETAVFVAQILSEAPQVQLLISSREPLNLQAEWRLPLDGLSYPAKSSQPTATSDATDLFMQTARRVCPDFQPYEAEWQAIIRICQLTQGVPLALQIAAAWTRLTSCATIAAEITRNLDFLATTLRDTPLRHRSIRAVFEQSWQSLSPAEQTRLAQISVFAGGFDLEAALFVMAGSMLELSTLLDKSLLRRDGNGRYDIHELLRQFAAEKLAVWQNNIASQTRQQHSAYYLRFIAAQKHLFSQSTTGMSWEAAQAEIDNVRQAWEWAVAHARWDEIGKAVDGLSLYYHMHGLYQEGLTVFSAASAQMESELDGKTAVAAANMAPSVVTLNQLHLQQIRILEAQNSYEDALQLAHITRRSCHQSGDERGLVSALAESGIVCWRMGDSENAQTYLTESLVRAKTLKLPRQTAYALHHLGNVLIREKDSEARILLQEAAVLYEEAGDLRDLANILTDLGSLNLVHGELELARTYYQRSVALHRKINNMAGGMIPLGNLGYLALLDGAYEMAGNYFEEMTPFVQKSGLDLLRVNQLNNLGHIALMQEDYAIAVLRYRESLRFAPSFMDKCESLLGLTAVIVAQGDMKTAVTLLLSTDELPPFGPFEETLYQRLSADIRAALSPAEWEKATTNHPTMTIDEKISSALAYLGQHKIELT